MRIIFLDIDGVLNSEVDYINNAVEKKYDIAPRPMSLLNRLIADTGAKVVVSSTWRLGETIPTMQKVLDDAGFKGEVIGLTPVGGKISVRGCEILQWLKDNETLLECDNYHEFKHYVIFDDDSDMLLWQQHNFIKLDGYVGLTPNSIHKAHFILTDTYYNGLP